MALEFDQGAAPGEVCATTERGRSAAPGGVSLMARFSTKAQAEGQLDDGISSRWPSRAARRLRPIVRRYYGFVRLKASSYFLIGGDSEDLMQEGLVGLYKAIRDFRTDRES